ncbi:response regulator [Siphonobacter sp. SORGH_AS_0500]|uniref:response regulator n=1 Tax=Siphonobacter sp. SORGH_AS_0500 TaxID=1864824 RepID=UPI002860EEE7|nr:response regulator [Siphonobacter sp. SORGH_AS_0500]MDR6193327.1 CheY-like chemotaxis protein [Siphonobacter sp. SORGH_AS_0500]
MKNVPLVLVVEDDDDDQFLLQTVVAQSESACELVFASNGEEALDQLASLKKKPSFILTDLNMPKLNGLELLKTLKVHPDWNRIPVIMLTTTTSPDVIAQSYESGASSYVSKPPSIEGLKQVWQNLYAFWILTAQASG